MIPGLRNATRYLFKQDDTTYEELLDAAKEAELEFTKSKGASARLKAMGVVDKNENSKIQELNNRIENLTATLKGNNVKPKSASAPCSPAKKSNGGGGPPKQRDPRPPVMGPSDKVKSCFNVIDATAGGMGGANAHLWETSIGGG